MTLTAHAIVGAAVASALPQEPLLAFALACGSHFLVDAIPHYDYQVRSPSIHPLIASKMTYDLTLFLDLCAIGLDALLGLVISVLLFGLSPVVLLGIAGGMLPDFLQFVWMRLKVEPFSSLQRFHQWIHSKNHLLGRPIFGFISQVLFLAAVVGMAKLYF